MTLTSGSLGPYRILDKVGEGGMGAVYRARDTKLQRDVALKVLPEAFAGDPDRLARFRREAQVLASLNHPNVAQIYGFEHAPAAGAHDTHAIVMELVEGVEVAGPLPLADTLEVARQVAEAVEFAHEKGVIHRDLKPANIKRTAEGVVKVLDFGLAKALDVVDDAGADTRRAMSPTLSLGATQAGLVLGTAAYMAPEQAKGRTVDRRSDVWAFGVVLYELLTGQRLFGGETVAETLAAVMKDPIALDALPPDTPRAIRSLVARCLERDLRRRLQSIGKARIVIENVIAGTSQDDAALFAPRSAPAGLTRWAPWAVAAAAALTAVATLGWSLTRPASPPSGAPMAASCSRSRPISK
jgi:serine/threonine-protein kinase